MLRFKLIFQVPNLFNNHGNQSVYKRKSEMKIFGAFADNKMTAATWFYARMINVWFNGFILIVLASMWHQKTTGTVQIVLLLWIVCKPLIQTFYSQYVWTANAIMSPSLFSIFQYFLVKILSAKQNQNEIIRVGQSAWYLTSVYSITIFLYERIKEWENSLQKTLFSFADIIHWTLIMIERKTHKSTIWPRHKFTTITKIVIPKGESG